jgi:nitrite reductase/ring-hydroxylating ferredoxin subunit
MKDAHRRSKWILCPICGQEFQGLSAKMCKECRDRMYQEGYRTYEQWVEDGNVPAEVK